MMKRMLIIDDDIDILEALEALLSMEGFSVKISSTTDVFKKINDSYQPDMIIMDVMLSGKDGRNVVKDLKRHSLTKDIPVIMISAHPTVRASTLKAGADDFLAKPFESRDLVSKVNNLL
jgi:DNA-binding response OmpR family regulator